MPGPWLTFMGSFIADLTFAAERLPGWGETVFGSGFRIGPGGKGSNQAIAAARLGAQVCFIGAVGTDAFGDLARRTWAAEGIDTSLCRDVAATTGSAAIVVHPDHGENAIVVDPGSGLLLTVQDVQRAAARIAESALFVTQLELAVDAVSRGLAIARFAGVPTILNPAPARPLPDEVYRFVDYLTPNESEASALAGAPVGTPDDAVRAAQTLMTRGVPNVVVTLGAQGAVAVGPGVCEHVPAFAAGPVVETTGAGDAFNGAFAVALSRGVGLIEATRFGCRVAGISVTRPGTAASMPRAEELSDLR